MKTLTWYAIEVGEIDESVTLPARNGDRNVPIALGVYLSGRVRAPPASHPPPLPKHLPGNRIYGPLIRNTEKKQLTSFHSGGGPDGEET